MSAASPPASGPDSLQHSRLVLDQAVARGVAAAGPVAAFQSPLHALYLPAHHGVALLKLLPSPAGFSYLKVVAVGPWFQAETAKPAYNGSDTETLTNGLRLRSGLKDDKTSSTEMMSVVLFVWTIAPPAGQQRTQQVK